MATWVVKLGSGHADAMTMDAGIDDQGGRGERVEIVRLARRRSSRVAAALSGVAMLAAGSGWLAFCVTVKPGAGAVSGAQVILLLMALLSAPMFAYAWRLLVDASSGGAIVVGQNALSIDFPRVLRRPIAVGREVVAGTLVDAQAVRNIDERLRFPVDGVRGYLYSSVAGSRLRILSAERAIPNLAIVFDGPLAFSEPRRRLLGASDFAPLLPLQPGTLVPGLLFRVADPAAAAQQFAEWSDPQRVRAALTGTPTEDQHEPVSPAIRRPLGIKRATRPNWPALSLIAAVFALFYAGRHAAFSPVDEALLAIGCALFLGGGVLDTRLRYQERGGFARVISVGLAASGLMIAIAVTALGNSRG